MSAAEERFNNVVSAVLGVEPDEVNDALSPDTVDTWDSLNQINLVGALEQEFGIHLTAENLADYQSIPGLRRLLVQHGVVLNDE
jgi:acyl carrier protein